jgi:hypothetical protein
MPPGREVAYFVRIGSFDAFAKETHQYKRFARPLATMSRLSGCPTY